MKLTTDPREAVAYALDSGTRTQAMADLAEMSGEGKKSSSVRATESHAKMPGTGADVNSEYWRVYSELRRMHRQEPAKYAVAIALSPVDPKLRRAVMGESYEALQERVEFHLAETGQRLAAKRAVRLFAMANTMIDLDRTGRRYSAGPEDIARHAFDWYGYRMSISHWAKTYRPDWALVDKCLCDLERDCFSTISGIIRETNRYLSEDAA